MGALVEFPSDGEQREVWACSIDAAVMCAPFFEGTVFGWVVETAQLSGQILSPQSRLLFAVLK